MKVKNAEFVASAVNAGQFPDAGLPEIALVGRSNVGKSSLINRLVDRKNLARTSSVPGKTQTLNFYRVNDDLHFVDLPGYGYARVSMTTRKKWGAMIESYLQTRKELKMVLLVVDMRHPPTADDQAMYEWLAYYRIPCRVVATKADKVKRSQREKQKAVIRETLGIPPEHPLLLFSAEDGTGKEELWEMIGEAIRS
jgi:GTP-binding protein